MAFPWLVRGQTLEGDKIMIPADKGFSDAWVQSLTARGAPAIWSGDELKYIGMPVGGLCAGQLYLGGDGKLWLWDIFNRSTTGKGVTYQGRTFFNSDGSTYVEPLAQNSPLSQGFAIKYAAGSVSGQRTLDSKGGWPDLHFEGKYPVGVINYQDATVPVAIKLEAFSPFIPLNFADSSLPATIMRYTVPTRAPMPRRFRWVAGWRRRSSPLVPPMIRSSAKINR